MRVSSGTRSPSLAPQKTGTGPRAQAARRVPHLPHTTSGRCAPPRTGPYELRRSERMASTYPVTTTAYSAMPASPMTDTPATKTVR
jgi:hypothetical protein